MLEVFQPLNKVLGEHARAVEGPPALPQATSNLLTASIHVGLSSKDVDLDRVFVQMKLSIVDPDRAVEVVPRISEYANSQNRVSSADFFSNHPFHVRLEDFSRRLYAPSRDGSFRQSKWFYERARGQYQDARGGMSQAERGRFDLEYPKAQVFTKTDLAKFLNVW